MRLRHWFLNTLMIQFLGDITKLVQCEVSNQTGYFQKCLNCNVRLLRQNFKTPHFLFVTIWKKLKSVCKSDVNYQTPRLSGYFSPDVNLT